MRLTTNNCNGKWRKQESQVGNFKTSGRISLNKCTQFLLTLFHIKEGRTNYYPFADISFVLLKKISEPPYFGFIKKLHRNI